MVEPSSSVRERLQTAALALFAEWGFEATTAAQIALAAGVTERTFFRHFPDKREVLFDGEDRVREGLLASIAKAPDGRGPLDVLFDAFHAFSPELESRRGYAVERQAVLEATPALRERELAKIAALAEALEAALERRGVMPLEAMLAARAGMAAFAHSTADWLRNDDLDLAALFDLAHAAIRRMACDDRPG